MASAADPGVDERRLTVAKRILVPLDTSQLAESALPFVADAARGSGATVRLLHVAPFPETRMTKDGRVIAYADQERERLQAEGIDYLQTAELHLEGVPVECAVRFGDPVGEILREAEAFGADLIVVTTAGRGAIRRAMLGSVAEQVFRRADIPVALFRFARPAE